jgi:hypothetical protein
MPQAYAIIPDTFCHISRIGKKIIVRDAKLLIFLLTIAMCGISGSLAMLRLRSADPAEVF